MTQNKIDFDFWKLAWAVCLGYIQAIAILALLYLIIL